MATATQDGQVSFPEVTSGGQDAGSFGLFTATSGGTRIVKTNFSNNPSALTAGQRYVISDGEIVITHTGGDFDEPGRRETLTELAVSQQLYIGLFSGTGTTELSGDNYARQSIDFTVA